MRILFLSVLLILSASLLPAARTLDVYFIDVEGGQATLVVSPSGESMLIDTGWAGHNNRDADRIVAAAKKARVKHIDYLVVTHYHADHVGGVPQLAAKIPIRNFVDHGPAYEHGPQADKLYNAYVAVRDKGRHIQVKPGDGIPIKDLRVQILSAGGEEIRNPLPGAGTYNPACDGFQMRPEDTTENARSIGMLITYGKFRIIDLGDLTWNKEYGLFCPNNKVGTVDVYVVSHHGMKLSGSAAMVCGLHPTVAIMDNGARKGGTPEAWQVLRSSPGLKDIWQLHYSIAGGKGDNPPDAFIANLDENGSGDWIKLSVEKDGTYTVTNNRNHFTRTYNPQN